MSSWRRKMRKEIMDAIKLVSHIPHISTIFSNMLINFVWRFLRRVPICSIWSMRVRIVRQGGRASSRGVPAMSISATVSSESESPCGGGACRCWRIIFERVDKPNGLDEDTEGSWEQSTPKWSKNNSEDDATGKRTREKCAFGREHVLWDEVWQIWVNASH